MAMSIQPRYNAYDVFAAIYDRYWGSVVIDDLLPIYDKLILGGLPEGATVLDVCCGSGQLASVLLRRGHTVIGLDGSLAMLRMARRNAPAALLVAADARAFGLQMPCSAAVSTFDSFNHLMDLDGLGTAFVNVHSALEPGGWFALDMNHEEGYRARWDDSFGFVGDDHACLVRTGYDEAERLGSFDVTIFERSDGWRRRDLTVTQRAYSVGEVVGALRRAGFADIDTFDAERDLGLEGGVGRAFYVCHRPVGG